jgi:broad specificity phosphatase PhoE
MATRVLLALLLAAACAAGAGAQQSMGAPVMMAPPPRGAPAAAAPLSDLAAPGRMLMLRHGNAPGGGDPPGFKLGDCATQRNLDEKGRAQARATGAAIRAALGPALAARTRVYSSQWCRAEETARLLGLGAPKPLPGLNSFFSDPAAEAKTLPALRAFLAGLPKDGPPVILVTHQVCGWPPALAAGGLSCGPRARC